MWASWDDVFTPFFPSFLMFCGDEGLRTNWVAGCGLGCVVAQIWTAIYHCLRCLNLPRYHSIIIYFQSYSVILLLYYVLVMPLGLWKLCSSIKFMVTEI